MKSQTLHAWQPSDLKEFKMDKYTFYHISLIDVQLSPETLTITLENKSQILQIVYDQDDPTVPIVAPIWNFRYGLEVSCRDDLPYATEAIFPDTLDKESYYFFKVQNSEFIKWNDRVCPFKSKDYPKLEHHLFLTGDDFIETLSTVKPKIIVKNK